MCFLGEYRGHLRYYYFDCLLYIHVVTDYMGAVDGAVDGAVLETAHVGHWTLLLKPKLRLLVVMFGKIQVPMYWFVEEILCWVTPVSVKSANTQGVKINRSIVMETDSKQQQHQQQHHLSIKAEKKISGQKYIKL